MIFRPELAKLILQGRKSQTRRRRSTDRPNVCRYEIGKSYAVQPGRGRPQSCRITITDVRLEQLGQITHDDARREGFTTTDEFFDYWATMHTLDRHEPVWVITFQLGDRTDTPRLLAARPGEPHGDYVSNPHLAMSDEPEAITETETEYYGKLAHARHHDRMNEPLRRQRDELAAVLERMRAELAVRPNETLLASVRRIDRELQVLNRKLAA